LLFLALRDILIAEAKRAKAMLRRETNGETEVSDSVRGRGRDKHWMRTGWSFWKEKWDLKMEREKRKVEGTTE
jgi:hypothetical protein